MDNSHVEQCKIIKSVLSELNIPVDQDFSLTAPCCNTNYDMLFGYKTLYGSFDKQLDCSKEYPFYCKSENRSDDDQKFFSSILLREPDNVLHTTKFGYGAVTLYCHDSNIVEFKFKTCSKINFSPLVSKLAKLERLYLMGDINFLPETFRGFKSLKYLVLDEITSNVSINHGDLPNLESVFIRGNNWTWTIPETFSKLTQLQLYSGNIGQTIPENVWNLHNLEYISITNNNLSGQIPENLLGNRNLYTIDLSNNQLEGDISKILSISKAKNIYLNNNKISGTINPNTLSYINSPKTHWEPYLSIDNNLIGVDENIQNFLLTSGLFLLLILLSFPKWKAGWMQIICNKLWIMDVVVNAFVVNWVFQFKYTNIDLKLSTLSVFIPLIFYWLSVTSQNKFVKFFWNIVGDLVKIGVAITLVLQTYTYVPSLSIFTAIVNHVGNNFIGEKFGQIKLM